MGVSSRLVGDRRAVAGRVSRAFAAKGSCGGCAERAGETAVLDAGCWVLKLTTPSGRTTCVSKPHSTG